MIRYGKNKAFLAVIFGTIALLLVAVVNGQPFYFPDTTNYMREADAAVVWVFGSRFATSWTDSSVAKKLDQNFIEPTNPSAAVDGTTVNSASSTSTLRSEHTNSLQSGVILSGRSVYYGFLLYLGELGGGFWLTVILQAMTVSYVLYLVSVRCFHLSLKIFLLAISMLACFSTAPFFVGFLMPYIFAAVAILATGVFVAFWNDITRFEKIVLAILLVYSLLGHLSHLLICILMFAVYIALSASSRFRVHYFRLACASTIAACVLLGAGGEIAFNAVVSKILGTSPITPPLVMARLINLGPGLKYLQAHCNQSHFVICRYQDRLPLDTDSFIWSYDPAVGIFAPASPEVKRALSDEQFSFALHVFEFDPAGVLYKMLRAGISQLTTFGLDEFRNKDGQWAYYSARLPRKYWNAMQGTVAFQDGWIVDMMSKLDTLVVILSCLFLVFVRTRYSNISKHVALKNSNFVGSQKLFIAIVGVGIVCNAFVCGGLSSIHSHYQARVVWLVPFIAMLVFAELFVVAEKKERFSAGTRGHSVDNETLTKIGHFEAAVQANDKY